jgi:hypothetical protein
VLNQKLKHLKMGRSDISHWTKKQVHTYLSMHLYNLQSEQTKEFFIRSLIEWDECIIYSLLNVQDLQSY